MNQPDPKLKQSDPKLNRPDPEHDPLADPALRGPGIRQTLRELFGRQRPLAVAQVGVASVCGGGCLYCPHTTMRGEWKAGHMAAQTFARLWPLLPHTGRVHLQGWGEPLLHPRFLDMARLARRADCQVSTTTCGLVMNEALAASLVDVGLDTIAFSLAGTTAQSHNSLRAGVDFDSVLRAVRLLQEVRRAKAGVHLELHFAYLMLASRIEEVKDLPDLMAELGMHAAVVSTLDYLPSPDWAAEAFAPDVRPEEREKTKRAGVVLAQAAARARAMGMRLHYSLPGTDPLPDCLEQPSRSVYIDCEGVFSPCIYLNLPTRGDDPRRRVFGSCLTQNPLDIWRGEDMAAFRAALASLSPDSCCLDCPKRFAAERAE